MALQKSIFQLCVLSLSLIALASSCIEETSRYSPIEPGESPLAYLNPSPNFPWNTMDNASVTIEVDDKFDNQYDYIVHVYAYHPLNGQEPNALFSGAARGNAPITFSLDFPSKMTNIYVEVVDPQGYSSVYGYDAPVSGASITLPCRVGVPAQGATRGLKTRATVSAADVDFTIPQPAEFPTFDTTEPGDASNLPDKSLWSVDGVYVVNSNEDQGNDNTYQAATSGQLRILVSKTLEIKKLTLANGAQMYILPGGKLKGEQVTLGAGALLHVADGASVDIKNVETQGSNALVYAAGDTKIKDKISFNNSDSHIYVAPTGQIHGGADVEYIQGDIYVDADETSSGVFEAEKITAKNTSVRLIVAPNAEMDIDTEVIFYGKIYNGGTFSCEKIEGADNQNTANIYNACTMVVTDQIVKIGDLYMKHATLSSTVSPYKTSDLKFTALKKYEPAFTHNIYLLDGSFMYVREFKFGQGDAYGLNNEGDSETSIVRCSEKLDSDNDFTFQGNVLYEFKKASEKTKIKTKNGAVASLTSQYHLEIMTCTGAVKTREEDPTEPDPSDTYTGSAQGQYTINFEDQWPVLGDYDVNDIVLHVKSVETNQNSNSVKQATFNFELLAVGAGYTLGMGLEFDEILNNQIESVVCDIEGGAGRQEDDILDAFLLDDKGLDVAEPTDKAIIPLFYNAHKVLLNQPELAWEDRPLLNTGQRTIAPRAFTVTLTFTDDANVTADALSSSALNFFIYRVVDTYDDKRVEIHLKNYPPTRNARYEVFLTNELKALPTGSYYMDVNGFPWGLIVSDVAGTSTPWIWPSETVLISKSYQYFDQWVQSDGMQHADWMDE